VSAGGQAGFRVGTRTLPLWQAVPPSLLDHVGREVLLGLRAEDVHDAGAGADPDAVALDGVVSHVEYTGGRHVVAVVVDAPPDGPDDGVLGGGSSGGTLHAFFPPRAVIRRGDAVRVTVDATRAHVFDPATRRALRHPPDGC
jgi:multiple sugar transport system ATP-binding protein